MWLYCITDLFFNEEYPAGSARQSSPFIFQSRDNWTFVILFNIATFGAASHKERAVQFHHISGASPMMKPVDVLGDDSDTPTLRKESLFQLSHSLVS